MNYTPLPESAGQTMPETHQEAPMSASLTDHSPNRKALFVGIIIILAVAIAALFYSIVNKQKSLKTPPIIVPTKIPISIEPEITSPVEDMPEILPEVTPIESTDSSGLVPTSALTLSTSPSPVNSIGSPSNEGPIVGGGDIANTSAPTITSKIAMPTLKVTTPPELPRAGLPIPLMIAAFLGVFVLLVGFVL